MNKELLVHYLAIGLTTAMLVFGLDVYNQEVTLTVQNSLTYCISALVGAVLAALYFSLVGHRLYKHQFLATVLPCILFALLAITLGSVIAIPLHDLTIIITSLLVISSSFEKRKN
ncbi:hypothetical protein C1E24_12000 [Pseudoalteromonas phenolica]|uniref:Uncharacterized protein n=1 Tax=Pseudoalteromonas phenolica TaxID=161398 RepID=A0A5R9Q0P1_9GAMM|nr:hypothetical protein [Pseudoalteromonas phenolica]TLX46723.1 hypothetical protein C1E24_12000 [Pseudoalteromonas phenolica]